MKAEHTDRCAFYYITLYIHVHSQVQGAPLAFLMLTITSTHPSARMYLRFVYYQTRQASIKIFTEMLLHSDHQNNVHCTLQAITPISPHTLLLITSQH